MREDLKREITIRPAYDKRAEGYGQHCVEMVFYLKGPLGAVQFVLFTGWYPSDFTNRIGKIYETALARQIRDQVLGAGITRR